MKIKKLLALVLTICLAFSCIAVVPFTASAADETPLATATKSAVFIGKSARTGVAANVFLPLTSMTSGDGNYALQDDCYVEFTCKVKMLSGTKPIVGMIRFNYSSTSKVVSTAAAWTDNNTSTYDPETGEFKVRIKLDDIPNPAKTYASETRKNDSSLTVSYKTGGNWGCITVGNMEHNGNWHQERDYDNSFIMTDPCLKVVQKPDGTAYSDSGNMLADFTSYNDQGLYGLASGDGLGNDTIANNHYFKAPSNTWSRDTYDPALVKFVKIDNDYLTSNRVYTQHAATANTREYYTCSDFGDNVKFEKLGTGCYNVISNDINKKAVLIGNDGTNKVANIYLPLYTHRYFQHMTNDGNLDLRDGYYGNNGGNVFYHISFKAKRLSGTGQPIVGRLYGYYDKGGCGASNGAAYNNGSGETSPDNLVSSSYNPTTGAFTAVIRFNKGYYRQLAPNGYNEFLTIGNAEHKWAGGEYDATSFDSSFIISDISIQVYDTDNTTLLDAEAAPAMVAGNYSFGPSTDTLDDLSTRHYYAGAGTNTHAGKVTALYNTAADTWTAEGAYQQIKAIDRNACNAASHTLVHHNATANTREYWSCATCAKNYVDKYASAECDTIYATPKMIAVKASGSRPGNAFITIDTPSSEGTHYYKFTCDMRIFGDEVPTISTVKGSYWGGNNAQSETSWTNNSDERNEEGLYASYDADTRKYEAIFKVEHSNASLPTNYFNAVSGAYAALLIGNGRHIGNNGYDNTKYYSSFIFGNPQIVEVDANNNFAVIGDNICPVISDKTLNFGTSYTSEVTQGVYNSENTMHKTNNILAAPVGKWHVDGNRSWVVSMDIPDDTFFTQDQGFAPKMVRTSGSGASYNAISTETFLKPGETYQFDIDYREFGSPARIFLEAAKTSGGYNNNANAITGTPTADNVDGAHKSVVFTMPADARNDGGGNFRIYLGQSAPNGRNKNTTTVNFANAQLRWYDTEEEEPAGRNIFLNGAFDFGEVGNITTQNANKTLFGWNAESITTFAKHDLITIPEGFFEGDIGENNLAMKINAENYAYIRTAVELLPDSIYELSYNYRATDDDIDFAVVKQGDTDLTYTKALVSNYSGGKYKKTYRITTFGSSDGYQSGNTQANTVLEFRCPANAEGNEFYINNIQLHKVVNNALVGMNMLGDRNAIYDESTYYPQNENDFTFATDANYKANSMIADLGHAWWSTKSTTTGSIVKVNNNFFTYLTPATRLAKLTEVLLGKADASNPYLDRTCLYYNPDGKGSTNVLDLVKLKKDIVNIGDEGGAGAEAAAMLSKINNAANTSTGNKTTYTVPKTASVSTLMSTLSNAANNSVVLLERGGVWRVPASSNEGFVLPNGVSLGAYGTGAKPVLLGSSYNYASRTWTEVSSNIWRTQVTGGHDANRPCTAFFYNNTTYSTKPLAGVIIKNNARFSSYSQLSKEGEVYYNVSDTHFTTDPYVYVYSTSNPKTKYTDIEIGEKHTVLTALGYNNIDNICIKYGGHGITTSGVNSVTVTNCDISYIGGTPNGSNETMGNGIQFGQGGKNLTVHNCYVHDCYDAGITFQSWSGQYTFDGVNFTDNLLVDNFYNIEFFTTGTPENKTSASSSSKDGTMKNINISGNIMRFAGGWSFNQRQGNQLRCANICVTSGAYYVNTQNMVITGNIFDCTMVQQVMWTWGFGTHTEATTHPGLTITGNTYYQKAGSLDCRVNRFGCSDGTSYDYAGSTDSLKTAIAKMDTRPTKVAWVNRTDKF